jgi:hypothetical protein
LKAFVLFDVFHTVPELKLDGAVCVAGQDAKTGQLSWCIVCTCTVVTVDNLTNLEQRLEEEGSR